MPTIRETLPGTDTAMRVTVWKERLPTIGGGYLLVGEFNGWESALEEIQATILEAKDPAGMANRLHAFEETITTTREALPRRSILSRVPGGTVNPS